ncbi:MAG TPA: hypothetical protein VGH28_19380 [Polyangiaceae bacterium]|jgi:hypothetical protein
MKKAVLLVLFTIACDGALFVEPGDGGPTPDAGSSECPSSPPEQGASCDHEGLDCEWGNDPNLACNTTGHCSGGQWSVQVAFGQCPTPPNPSGCPSSFTSVPVGQLCGSLVGTTCSYQQGFCGCSAETGGPYPADAAAIATWICESPEPGCPQPRPKLGSSCSQEGLACDYAPCSLPTGASLVCQNGAWQDQPYGCAL